MKFDAIIVIVVYFVFSLRAPVSLPLQELNYHPHELKNFPSLRMTRRNVCRISVGESRDSIAIAINDCNASGFFINIAVKL